MPASLRRCEIVLPGSQPAKVLELDPGDYSRLRKLEAVIATDENSDAVLKKQ